MSPCTFIYHVLFRYNKGESVVVATLYPTGDDSKFMCVLNGGDIKFMCVLNGGDISSCVYWTDGLTVTCKGHQMR